MSDQPTHTPTSQTITISLADMAQRYLGAMQRIHDTATVLLQGTREVNERGYDELTAAARFLPAQKQRRLLPEAKPIAERWILKNILADAFGTLVPFLEDARTVASLHAWKKAGSDQATLPAIFQQQRAEFLKKDIPGKLAHLAEAHDIRPQLTEPLAQLETVLGCLLRHDGIVPAAGPALSLTLVALDLVPAPDASRKVQPRMGELQKEFAPGTTIHLDKVEYLNAIATVSLFMNATLRILQEKLSA